MKMFEFRESGLAMVNRIFIVALAAAKTEGWMFLKCWRAPMAQTRRMGMQNDFARLPNAPRFSPYHYEASRAAGTEQGISPQLSDSGFHIPHSAIRNPHLTIVCLLQASNVNFVHLQHGLHDSF
jgi:hypothetical protein